MVLNLHKKNNKNKEDEMEKKKNQTHTLHTLRVDGTRVAINRAHILLHTLLVLALLCYRASWLFFSFLLTSTSHPLSLKLTWSLLLASELSLFFIWLMASAFRWRPVHREAFPERLSDEDSRLPALDVFICTADPKKEPPVDVMNTVLSAMAMDYPAEKLWVYVSDDGGAAVTLHAMKKAFSFAKIWVPFCKRYGVRTTCPRAYFSHETEEEGILMASAEFLNERQKMKFMYEVFEEQVERAEEMGLIGEKAKEIRPPLIEVIDEKALDMKEEHEKMPKLVYVRREKRPNYPHNFKAGALNVLLRVSSLLSNGPYVLALDCDMYSNDSTSAKAAMCFHLDPILSPSLAFVQFPQTFHNISPNDIYGGQLREVFKVYWNGCDGLHGPILSGTCFYIKRKALYGATPGLDLPEDLIQRRQWFGHSNELMKTLHQDDDKCNAENGVSSSTLLQEAHLLASCTYEKGTEWGKQIGFLYDSVVEDYITGFKLHCRGWKSVYCDPSRPQFLGSAPTNLNDLLVQIKRWASGLLEVAFSRYCPLIYGIMSGHSILHSMCYGFCAFMPFYSIFALCYATLPQLCLLNGISLYPKVSDPWFAVFLAVFISASCQHLFEVLSTGGSFKMWWNEQRVWMVKAVSSNVFGCLDIATSLIGVKRVDFELTNKVTEKDQVDRYMKGVFDFQGVSLILVPVVTSSILSMIAFIWGLWRVISEGNYSQMIIQLFLSLYIVICCYPILEGVAIRKDTGRMPTSITYVSIICTMALLSLGSIIFKI